MKDPICDLVALIAAEEKTLDKRCASESKVAVVMVLFL